MTTKPIYWFVMANKMIDIISLGGGVQSTAMVLMSLHGELPRAACAIFADTGWEREATYQNIRTLTDYAKGFDFPVYTVGNDNIREKALNLRYGGFADMPFYTDINGKLSITKRQCTDHYKIRPIRKKMLDLFGRKHFRQWIGISLDEVTRMKPSPYKRTTNYYPLVEKQWTRANCIDYLKRLGVGEPSRSSCIGCPYHSNREWERLTDSERADAIEVDEAIRQRADGWHHYLHSSGQPLRDFYETADQQGTLFDMDMEQEECEGMCFL